MSRSGLIHYDSVKGEWYDVPEEPKVWDRKQMRWVPKENPAAGASDNGAKTNEFGEVSP